MNKEVRNDKSSVSSLSLVNVKQSSRLDNIRKKALETKPTTTEKPTHNLKQMGHLSKKDQDILWACRLIIDQKIAAIVGKFPPNKQESFFKIRFGLSLKQLKEHSIKKINTILNIPQESAVTIKLLGEINYFGNRCDTG